MIDQRHTVCSPILATCSILAVPAAWPRRPSLAEAFESKILQEISPRNSNHRPSVGEIFALIESPFKGAPTVIAAIAMTLIHKQAVRHRFAGTAPVTSLVVTLKLASVHGPNEVTIATSVASRPRAIKIRPMRGLLWRSHCGGLPPTGKALDPAVKTPPPHAKRRHGSAEHATA